MNRIRSSIARRALLAVVLACPLMAKAQSPYPSRPVTLIVSKALWDQLEQQGVETAGTPTQPVASEQFAKRPAPRWIDTRAAGESREVT